MTNGKTIETTYWIDRAPIWFKIIFFILSVAIVAFILMSLFIFITVIYETTSEETKNIIKDAIISIMGKPGYWIALIAFLIGLAGFFLRIREVKWKYRVDTLSRLHFLLLNLRDEYWNEIKINGLISAQNVLTRSIKNKIPLIPQIKKEQEKQYEIQTERNTSLQIASIMKCDDELKIEFENYKELRTTYTSSHEPDQKIDIIDQEINPFLDELIDKVEQLLDKKIKSRYL